GFDAFDEFDEEEDAFADYDAVTSAPATADTGFGNAADDVGEEEFELPDYLLELDDDADVADDAGASGASPFGSAADEADEEFELPDYLLELDDPDEPDF